MNSDHSINAELDQKGWYPGDTDRLTSLIDRFINEDYPVGPQDDALAIVAPHAGYRYSGAVAGYAFSTVFGFEPTRIVVIGPSHFAHIPNQISMPDAHCYTNVLGRIPIETAIVSQLKEREANHFISHPKLHKREHSIQILLPFIQSMFPGTPVLPLVIGQTDRPTIHTMAEALKPHITPDTLIVISSDFTHYGEMFDYVPFTENILENIERIDFEAIDYIQHRKVDKFYTLFDKKAPTICGEHAFKLMFELLPESSKGNLLEYRQSGFRDSPVTHSVSYAAMAITGKW